MSGVAIEKGIPVPAHANRKYPWDEMQPGDSIFIPGKEGKQGGGIIASAKRVSGGGMWVTRTVTENGVTGVRVWRVA